MYSIVPRSSAFAPCFRATKSLGGAVSRNAFPTDKETGKPVPKPEEVAGTLTKATTLNCRVSRSINGAQQYRYAHTDRIIDTPNFDEFRKQSGKHYDKKGEDPTEDLSSIQRKNITYVLGAGVLLPGAVVGKHLVRELVNSFNMTKDVLAMSKTEVKLNEIPEGKTVLMTWRSKPLFIRHRTAEEIENEAQVPIADLRDPQHDHERVKKPEWLLIIGVCTHLGCVPVCDAGIYGGFFCPCHGSHYDISGRIRKGPAPLNLEVPPYEFVDDDLCVVG